MCIGRLSMAVCTCGGSFPVYDYKDAVEHITFRSNPNHHWIWLHPKWALKIKLTVNLGRNSHAERQAP